MKCALFPGSFDPFTVGHLDLFLTSITLFDKVIVGVGYNHRKSGFLSPEARVMLIKTALAPYENSGTEIEVVAYSGLTADFCAKIGAQFIIRGLRTTADLESEMAISAANRMLYPGLQTVMLPAVGEHSFVSSTIVRDIYVNGGDVSAFLPEGVILSDYIK